MLVPAMNHQEIAAQVKSEYQKIYDTTLLRVASEYDRERRKLKISKKAIYPKEYEIRTAGKNNWIIFLHKIAGVKKYTGKHDIHFMCAVYYNSDKGLMVYTPLKDKETLAGFTSHFFKRYNERLCLNLHNPIDIVKAFFRKGLYSTQKEVERNNRPHLIAFGVDGIRFAEIMYDGTYIEWKTFVPRDLAFRQQKEWEHKLSERLLKDLKESEKEDPNNFGFLLCLKSTMVSIPVSPRKIA